MNRKTRNKERLKTAKERLQLYYAAEEAILNGAQSYKLATRELTRADLGEIRKMITALEDQVEELETLVNEGYSRRCLRALPRDI